MSKEKNKKKKKGRRVKTSQVGKAFYYGGYGQDRWFTSREPTG